MKLPMFGCVVGLLLSLYGSQVAAQPLADIARQEKLRREALAAKAAADNVSPKAYTNADLRGGGRLTTTDVSRPPPPAASAAETALTSTTEDAPEPPGATLDEDQWRSRINAVRQARDRAQLMAEALQNRVDGLWADFTGRDDPAQRAVIEQNRLAAVEELDRTTAEIETLTQQIVDIQEEARRANVPPGWLR